MLKKLIRYSAYPLVAGGAALAIVVCTLLAIPYWPAFPLIAASGLLAVALLEQLAPYEPAWLLDHGDLRTDLLHNMVNLTTLLLTVEAVFLIRGWLPAGALWPLEWPVPVQILLAGAIVDFGLYLMHRWSHSHAFLWRLHAIHHSPERLYWLNGERRHPLSAVVLAAPGIVTVVALGAPSVVLAAWLSFLTVHLAFQHANLDYRLGPFRYLLGVAEIHRWHHKRDYEDAQVNFGEFWLIWDHLFGTFYEHRKGVQAGDLGLRDELCPLEYAAQLRWPFRDSSEASRAEHLPQ